ncbi:MAG: flagellar basal body-associated FliL family protein [Bacteriovoracaceae bacterium]|nr:flagellar basal body-associated FliL family protein [Bacteriovoracaceae bacterium]
MAGEELNEEEFSRVKDAKLVSNPLFTIFLIVNSVLLAGIGYVQFMSYRKEANRPPLRELIQSEINATMTDKEVEQTGEAKEEDGILFALEGFTANLAQGDGPRRFVRLHAVLKFSKDSDEEEFKARKPQIRDTIISILNSKRAEDLLKREGKSYLKEEIKSAINTFLIGGSVIDIFYVGFQIK